MASLIVSYDFAMANAADQMRYFSNSNPFSNWPVRENEAIVISASGSLVPEGDGSAKVVVEYTIEDY